jgi:isoleucyl-tRNA synthetase
MKLDFKKSGAKFGKLSNLVNKSLQTVTNEEAISVIESGYVNVLIETGETVKVDTQDILVEKSAKEGFASATNGEYTVTLDTLLTEVLIQEGTVRELIRSIQEYRKELNLPINMRVDIGITANPEFIDIIEKFKGMLEENLLMRKLVVKKQVSGKEIQVGDYQSEIELVASN